MVFISKWKTFSTQKKWNNSKVKEFPVLALGCERDWRETRGTSQCGIIISLSLANNKVHLVIVECWPKNTRENKRCANSTPSFQTVCSVRTNGPVFDDALKIFLLFFFRLTQKKGDIHQLSFSNFCSQMYLIIGECYFYQNNSSCPNEHNL